GTCYSGQCLLVLSAQSEPEMARDRFGFLERHGFVNCSVGALQHLTLGRRSTPRVQTNCVKCDVVDSELRFNCVSNPPQGLSDGQAASQAITGDTTMLCLDFRAPRKNDPLLPDAGTWRNNHVHEGISDAPRASGLAACLSLT